MIYAWSMDPFFLTRMLSVEALYAAFFRPAQRLPLLIQEKPRQTGSDSYTPLKAPGPLINVA